MEKYSEMLVIKMKPSELQALEKVAKALQQPVSTVARQVIMRAVGPLREDGVIETLDGELAYRKDRPQVRRDRIISKMDAIKMMRAEMKVMEERLAALELKEIVHR